MVSAPDAEATVTSSPAADCLIIRTHRPRAYVLGAFGILRRSAVDGMTATRIQSTAIAHNTVIIYVRSTVQRTPVTHTEYYCIVGLRDNRTVVESLHRAVALYLWS